MRLIHKSMLREFRLMTRCAWCDRKVQECDPAHIYGRGAGQVDIRENVVNLCHECHVRSHANQIPSRGDLLKIAAAREGTDPDTITDMVYAIRRDKSCKVRNLDEEVKPICDPLHSPAEKGDGRVCGKPLDGQGYDSQLEGLAF